VSGDLCLLGRAVVLSAAGDDTFAPAIVFAT